MLLAKDAQGNLVLAETFTKENRQSCYCPGCGGSVIFKQGIQKIAHFAHQSKEECQHFAEGETVEHLTGKQLLMKALPEDTQLEAYLPNLAQRPDLLWKTLAVEFQCSSLSRVRFEERTHNYLAHGYTPWWLVGRRFFPQTHWRQVTRYCLQDGPLEPILWGVDVVQGKLLMFHSFDWHYQKGLSFETSSRSLQAGLFGELFLLSNPKKTENHWSCGEYQTRIQEKLVRKEKSLLQLQGDSYLWGLNLGALPYWCYRPSRHQALLQEGLLFLRGLYGKKLDFETWVEIAQQVLDWPYTLVNRRRVYQEVFAECMLLEEE